MPIFKMSCRVTVSAYTNVEAQSEEEAMEIAASRDVCLGGVGSGAYGDESWIIEEPDGEPQDIQIEKD